MGIRARSGIVLAACALAFCFTNLPFLLQRSRLTVSLGAASGCLVLLLLACWVNVGGWWIIGGLAITAASLALPWAWWAVCVFTESTCCRCAWRC